MSFQKVFDGFFNILTQLNRSLPNFYPEIGKSLEIFENFLAKSGALNMSNSLLIAEAASNMGTGLLL